MKRQVIDKILEYLDIEKDVVSASGLSVAAEKHQRLGLERAIRIVLKHADIADLRPAYKKK